MPKLISRTGKMGYLQSWLSHRRGVRLGPWGEWIALRHLRRLNWDIVAKNWTTARGELDLVAYDEEFIVFVEVKTRRAPSLILPEEQVDERKRDKLERLGMTFLQRFELGGMPIRFDLIAIETPDKDSFTLRHYLGFM